MGLTNNDIIKKLRVALQLTDEDIVNICAKVDFKVTKAELGGFFRKEGHPKYVELGDQILRNFLDGLIVHKRGPRKYEPKVNPERSRSTRNPRYDKKNTEVARKPKKNFGEGGSSLDDIPLIS